MGAVVGIWFRDGRTATHRDLEAMMKPLAHRAPGPVDVWVSGPVGLGGFALSTLGGSNRAGRPGGGGDVVVAADARVDNRSELLRSLGLTARPDMADGELILRAYDRWGEDCPGRVVGDFAFAIWDGHHSRLLCARDQPGVKPLYYYQSHQMFAFASEIKALLSLREVPVRLNPARVADHCAGIFDDRVSTFYKDIFRLPPGHGFVMTHEGVRQFCHRRLELRGEMKLGSDDQYADAFRELFTEVVRCRLRGRPRVGALLSGGLDTSSIVGTARRVLRDEGHGPLPTFSAIFPSLPEPELRRIDERGFVDALVETGGIEPHFVRGDTLSPLTEIERVLANQDEPVFAPNLYLHWALYRAAAQNGVVAVLDGIDGDTVVSHGLEYLPDLARSGRWRVLARELGALSRRYRKPFGRLLWECAVAPLCPDTLQRAVGMIHGRWGSDRGIIPMNPAFARSVGLRERLRASRSKPRPRSARERHWQGMVSGLYAYTLEAADKAAAAFGVEPRYPFLDVRLAEFCLALPPEQKLRNGWTRLVMRHAMAGILPDAVRWRTNKANLGVNFRRRLREGDRVVLEDVIVRSPDALEEFVDLVALRQALWRCGSDSITDEDALAVFGAVTLALWLKSSALPR